MTVLVEHSQAVRLVSLVCLVGALLGAAAPRLLLRALGPRALVAIVFLATLVATIGIAFKLRVAITSGKAMRYERTLTEEVRRDIQRHWVAKPWKFALLLVPSLVAVSATALNARAKARGGAP